MWKVTKTNNEPWVTLVFSIFRFPFSAFIPGSKPKIPAAMCQMLSIFAIPVCRRLLQLLLMQNMLYISSPKLVDFDKIDFKIVSS